MSRSHNEFHSAFSSCSGSDGRAVVRTMAQSQEAVRRQVASLLHGTIQTRLLMARHLLDDLASLLPTDVARAQLLVQQCQGLIDTLRTQDVQKATRELYPSIIELGLLPALRALADSLIPDHRLTIAANALFERWDDPLETAARDAFRLPAYRLVGEAVSFFRQGGGTQTDVGLRLSEAGILQISVDCPDSAVTAGETGREFGVIDAWVRHLGGCWGTTRDSQGGVTLWVRSDVVVSESR